MRTMSGMHDRWIKLALKMAKRSTHPKFKMGAVIARNGSIISKACNLAEYGKHAEYRAIRRASKLDGAVLYIARLGGNGSSVPCKKCLELIMSTGIWLIFCTDVDGRPRRIGLSQ